MNNGYLSTGWNRYWIYQSWWGGVLATENGAHVITWQNPDVGKWIMGATYRASGK